MKKLFKSLKELTLVETEKINGGMIRLGVAGFDDIERCDDETEINVYKNEDDEIYKVKVEGKEIKIKLLLEPEKRVKSALNSRTTTLKGWNKILIAALYTGDLDIVKKALLMKANVNIADDVGYTPLYIATRNNNSEIVELLIKLGAKPSNAIDDRGRTILYYAVQNANENIVKLLLENGTTPKTAGNAQDHTILHDAVEGANLYSTTKEASKKIVEILLTHGANVNATDYQGSTALFLEIRKEKIDKDIVELLLKYGANPNSANFGYTGLSLSTRMGNKNVVALLLKYGADVKINSINGETLLHSAALGGNKEIIEILLKLGLDVKAIDDNGRTILHEAALGGNKEIIEMLLKLGLDIKAIDNNGRTLLHEAAELGNKEIIEMFLKLGLDARAIDKKSVTPLHLVIYRQNFGEKANKDAVELLLKNNANVNAVDEYKRVALSRVVEYENEDMIKLLLQYGANITNNLIENPRIKEAKLKCERESLELCELITHSPKIKLIKDLVVVISEYTYGYKGMNLGPSLIHNKI